MKVREIMTLGAITVGPNATIGEAASLMLRHGVSGLPVVSGFKPLAGIVTEGDLMRCADTGSGRDSPGWLIFLVNGVGCPAPSSTGGTAAAHSMFLKAGISCGRRACATKISADPW